MDWCLIKDQLPPHIIAVPGIGDIFKAPLAHAAMTAAGAGDAVIQAGLVFELMEPAGGLQFTCIVAVKSADVVHMRPVVARVCEGAAVSQVGLQEESVLFVGIDS